MKHKRSDIAICFSLLSVMMVFIFAMTQWKHYASSPTLIGRHLYYISVSFVMYIYSLISLMQAKARWNRILSALGFALFGTNLYVEFFGSPEDWSNWDKTMFIVFALNLLLSIFIIEKLKDKK